MPEVILDHSAGTGVWGAVARERWPHAYIIGVELQPSSKPAAYDAWYGGMSFQHYAAYALRHKFRQPDFIPGNPPYKYTEAFVRLSLAMLAPGGYLLQLLRTAFLEGQERGDHFWQKHTPIAVDTCSRRPSFTGNGKTDATSYSTFLWQKGVYPSRYSGGWLRWQYGAKIAEDAPFRPIPLLADPDAVPHMVLQQDRLPLEVTY
jgi:hypothetical protein